MATSTLVAEEMGDWCECSGVCTFLLSLLELILHEVSHQLLCLDLGEFGSASILSFCEELLFEEFWESVELRVAPWSQQLSAFSIVVELRVKLVRFCVRLGGSEHLVELDHEVVEGAYVLEEALWDEDASIVLLSFGSLLDDVTEVVNDVFDRLVAVLALFGDDHEVGMGLEGTLDCEVGWLLAHESDEVPVLDGRGTVSEHVSDQLRVDLRCCVESNSRLEIVVLEVTVDRCRHYNDPAWSFICLEIFRKIKSICHCISGSNNYQTIQFQIVCNLHSLCFLLFAS